MSTSLYQQTMKAGEGLSQTFPISVRRYWRVALISFVGWSLLAAIPTTSAYLGMGAQGFPVWWAMFKKIGLYYYLWGLSAPALYRLTDALPYRGNGIFATILTHLVVFLVLSFGFGFIAHHSAWDEWVIGARAVGYHSMSAFTYALIVLCSLAVKFYRLSLLRQREASDAKVLAAQLDSKLNRARVDSLRMQMNPHFLFNALNSVAALIDSGNRDRAYQAIEQLGDLLRRALDLSRATDVSLDNELRFCEVYLSLEQIRFGDRLNVRWQVSDALRTIQVPAFVLQPLVENAIKHAVSPSAETITVTISVDLADNKLQLRVSDNGAPPVSSGISGSGLGISNLRERLRLRYGLDVTVNSDSGPEGYLTVISIPRQLLDTAPSA